ncbi:hypothetical protein [[Ruminococcus] torques]|uniref:hypothetical protein n=1 Tax=[Ruminococcus] torques TaxID=33039 RepID=UPI0025A37FD9|nr:hypothetical protein [[Ruminococcus] torques]MDM8237041.1 hypothetical protein [[Ruminococcus] torques]
MIGNPFCTIKVFWNFHTKNRLAQVRHIIFGKLALKRPAQIPKKGATVRRTAKNQGWKRRLHRSVGRDTGGCPAGAAACILIQEKAEGTG